jgi:deazaflavin-dependent oxidoreductase (nitroreductase family)
MTTKRPNAILRHLFRVPIYLYRWRCGWLLGHRLLLLIHVGRRTGLLRLTVLEIMEFRNEPLEVIVMSGFGRNADWLLNIERAPSTEEVVVGSRRFVTTHRVLDENEAVGVLAGYEQRNWLFAAIIRAVLSRLVGWRYDGSTCARRRLVAQLPLIAFRPRS